MNEPIRRTDAVKIKLAPEILSKLEEHSRAYGMPPSTLAAFAVAEWLQRQDTNARLARMAVMDATRNSFGKLDDLVSEETLERVLGPALAAFTQQALAQANLPLDK